MDALFIFAQTRVFSTLLKNLMVGMLSWATIRPAKSKELGPLPSKCMMGQINILEDVRYVSKLKINLISLGALDHSEHTFKIENGKMIVTKGSLVVTKAIKSNGLYVLAGSSDTRSSSLVEHDQNKMITWHLRLGHVSKKGLFECTN